MKLTKKHIGGVYDVKGGDGSWGYVLLDIKGKELLFYVLGTDRYEIDTNKYHDWREYPGQTFLSPEMIKNIWKTARRYEPCK